MNEDRQLLDLSITEPKSFQTMPIEVIEHILDFVDFADKKSFSETCKRFAKIVGDQMSLKRRIWLKLSNEVATSHHTRTYADLNWVEEEEQTEQTMPREFFERMAPAIRSLKLDSPVVFELEYLINAGLANFVNLTYLDLSLADKFHPNSSHAADNPVDMKHLEYLSIKLDVFAQLNGRFINFATKKLHTLELCRGFSDVLEVDITKICTLLEQQTRLRVLNLMSEHDYDDDVTIFDIFNQPLAIPSKLLQFRMDGRISSVDQLTNLFNLIRAQNELTLFEVRNFNTRSIVGIDGSAEFESLLKMLLDYPLEEQKFFDFTHPEREVPFQMEHYRMEEENSIQFSNRILQFDRPNVHTEKLLLMIGERCGGAELLNYVVKKFPDTKSVEIVEIHEGASSLTVIPKDLSPLNSLNNLKSLKVKRIGWLGPVNIENLQHFGFRLHDLHSQLDIAALMEFINRHKTIESLFGTFYGVDALGCNFSESGLGVLEHVCKNLKNVKLVKFLRSHNGRDEEIRWCDMICATVYKYACSGFMFDIDDYPRTLIMKRYDGEVVKRVGDGLWQKVDVPLKLRLRRHKKIKI